MMDGGAICDACPMSGTPLMVAFIISSPGIPYISVGAGGNCELTLGDRYDAFGTMSSPCWGIKRGEIYGL